MKENIAYLRISTNEQEQDERLQTNDVLSLCPEAIVYREHGSAWKDNLDNRPIFKEIYEKLKNDKLQSINVWDVDRLYRKRKLFVAFMRLCDSKGVIVRSYRQKYLQSFENVPAPWGEMMKENMIQMLGFIAEEESKKKSERVKLAIRKSETGTKSYKGNKWGRKSLPDNTIQEVKSLHSLGVSIRGISKVVYYWDKNKQKKFLSVGAVHKIIAENTAQKVP